jgi:CHAT domain-containing protein
VIAVLLLATAAALPLAECAELESRGAQTRAASCFEAAIPGIENPGERFLALERLGWIHVRLGDLEKSFAAFAAALKVSQEAGDRALEARATLWIGFVHQSLNDDRASLDHYRKARALAVESGNRKTEAEAIFHIGWSAYRNRAFAAATAEFRQSLAICQAIADRKGEVRASRGLGMVSAATGQHAEALQHFDGALAIARLERDSADEAMLLDHLGLSLTAVGRSSDAIEYHERSLRIRADLGDEQGAVFTHTSLSQAREASGDLRGAAEDLEKAVMLLERTRSNLAAAPYRASMQTGVRRHHELLVRLLFDLHRKEPGEGHDARAFAVSERARARMTLDTVQKALARSRTQPDSELLLREEALLAEIDRSSRELDAVTRKEAQTDAVDGLRVQVQTLASELRNLQDRIGESFPSLIAARNAPISTAQQIRGELLDRETALVEYFLGRDRSYAWVLTRGGISFVALPARESIETAARTLHELSGAGDQRKTRHAVERAADRLASLILHPLPIPRSTRRLVIVPDGALHYTPFSALPTGEGRLVIDEYEVAITPSASALALLRQVAARRAATEGVALFADPVFAPDDPRLVTVNSRLAHQDLLRAARAAGVGELHRLPATRSEAEAIAAAAGGTRVHLAFDFEATRDSLLQRAASYRYLHIATHAFIHPDDPELSGMALSLYDARGRPIDGFFRWHDLYRRRLSADLVTLSACRTAIGRELRGEGIVGLVSGFMHAGTPRVVASFWNVRDRPTAELMRLFYEGILQRNERPAAALRAAQLTLRRDERWGAPYYWSAFALHGDWR